MATEDDKNQSSSDLIGSMQSLLEELKTQQNQADECRSNLIEDYDKLSQNIRRNSEKSVPSANTELEKHYGYILPLMKDIYHLELKVKEKQEEYDRLLLDKEIIHQRHSLLAEYLSVKDSVLKMWLQDLLSWSNTADSNPDTSNMCTVNNVTYLVEHNGEELQEKLGFTVLCNFVHVRVSIKSVSLWPCLMIGLPKPIAVGVRSDTFIPKLKEKVIDSYTKRQEVSDVVIHVSQYIAQDMAPFVIVCPSSGKVKKKVKSKDNNK